MLGVIDYIVEKFVKRESRKHNQAKNILKRWFSEQERLNDSCRVAQFKWRTNYGAYSELMFYETSDPYYFEQSKGLLEYAGTTKTGRDRRGKNRLKWFDPNFDRGKFLFQPDVTIFHKGVATILLEVVYTNPTSTEKLERIKRFFNGHHVELYDIDAEEILRYEHSPTHPEHLNCKRLI